MDLGLQGKVALVTGGSRGIGRGLAEARAAEGARVAVTSRSRDSAAAVAGPIGGKAYAFDSDDLDATGPLVDAVTGDLGPIDGLHRQHRGSAARRRPARVHRGAVGGRPPDAG